MDRATNLSDHPLPVLKYTGLIEEKPKNRLSRHFESRAAMGKMVFDISRKFCCKWRTMKYNETVQTNRYNEIGNIHILLFGEQFDDTQHFSARFQQRACYRMLDGLMLCCTVVSSDLKEQRKTQTWEHLIKTEKSIAQVICNNTLIETLRLTEVTLYLYLTLLLSQLQMKPPCRNGAVESCSHRNPCPITGLWLKVTLHTYVTPPWWIEWSYVNGKWPSFLYLTKPMGSIFSSLSTAAFSSTSHIVNVMIIE